MQASITCLVVTCTVIESCSRYIAAVELCAYNQDMAYRCEQKFLSTRRWLTVIAVATHNVCAERRTAKNTGNGS